MKALVTSKCGGRVVGVKGHGLVLEGAGFTLLEVQGTQLSLWKVQGTRFSLWRVQATLWGPEDIRVLDSDRLTDLPSSD